jgi:6-phosphogluconate dehydrogenase (decarboxylating)
MDIGMVGLGKMGANMVERLLTGMVFYERIIFSVAENNSLIKKKDRHARIE